MDRDSERAYAERPAAKAFGYYQVPPPRFNLGVEVQPRPEAAVKPAAPVGIVESRAWTELLDRPGYWRYTVRWPASGISVGAATDLRPADRLMCDVKVVVGGAPFKFESFTTERVESLVRRAIVKAGVVQRPADGWELRTKQGRILTHLVGDAELVDGETVLFLDPTAGGGATRDHRIDALEYAETAHRREPTREALEKARDAIAGEAEDLRDALVAGEGWQGTQPAEGTRRRIVLDTLTRDAVLPPGRSLELADAIESALLHATIEEEADELPQPMKRMVEDCFANEQGPAEDAPSTLEHFKEELAEAADDAYMRLLRQREEARAGEDHFKGQRDSALGLLRWLIGDLIPVVEEGD